MIPPVPTVGFALTLERAPQPTTDLRAHLVKLVTSETWGRSLRYFTSLISPGYERSRRPGVIPKKSLEADLAASIAADENMRIYMSTSTKSDGSSAECWFDTQLRSWSEEGIRCGGQRPVEPGDTVEAWLAAVLSLIEDAPASRAVIFSFNDHRAATSESHRMIMRLNDVIMHPYPKQIQRMTRPGAITAHTVRFPRWGTLYSHAHVAALGGVAKIVDAVQPAVVRELPGGVYFQLTGTLEPVESDEATRKRRAFTELAEPLLPPPLPAP